MSARLAFLSSLLISCQSPPPVKETDGRAALSYAKTQVDFGPRIPGTDSHRATGDWLEKELRVRADSVVVQTWPHRNAKGDTVVLRNFIGRFNVAATRRILFFAHWDSKPTADYDSGARAKLPVPGANDGASGVAVLLAMADALKKQPPTIGVDLLMVDGEDYGTFTPDVDVLLGSKHYAANPLPGGPPEYAILLDIVGGQRAQFRREGNSLIGAPGVVDHVWDVAARMGYGNLFLPESGGTTTDDHIPLQQAGIRAIDVIGDYGPGTSFPWWHTADDTVDKLSPDILKGVADVMVGVVRAAKRIE